MKHPIDSTGIDHAQIYAQLKAELERGTVLVQPREENALRLHNAAFYRICPAGEVLRRYYRAAQPNEKVRPLSLPEIFCTVAAVGTRSDGRRDAAKTGSGPRGRRVQKIHTHYGNRYRVVEL